MKRLFTILSGLILLTGGLSAGENDHLDLVRRYADALIEHGTDVYGEEKSGMLLSILERKRLRSFEKMPKGPSGVRQGDRVTPRGSNVNLDQNLYRVLYLLSEITGDPKYREAADAALTRFLDVAAAPKTGLLAWGEHLCWDLETDNWGTHIEEKPIHEPKRPTVLFDTYYRLNPETMIGYCDGLWKHQIHTHKDGSKDGNFSRHARYDFHDTRTNFDFPKEGGYFIYDWARAYGKTGDARFLGHIDVLAGRYLKKLGKTKHQLLEFDSTRNFADTSASLSLVVDSHRAAERIGDVPVREKLRELMAGLDAGLLALPHQVEERGFVQYVTAEDDYELYPHKEHGGYAYQWNMKYGRKTTAMLGVLCHSRAEQLDDSPEGPRYRELATQAARSYLASDPDFAERPWPVELGIVMFLQLAAHESTGEAVFLERAEHFAALARSAYWTDDSPLPKADPDCDHYENVTRADTIALALLKLHSVKNGLTVEIPISDIDR